MPEEEEEEEVTEGGMIPWGLEQSWQIKYTSMEGATVLSSFCSDNEVDDAEETEEDEESDAGANA